MRQNPAFREAFAAMLATIVLLGTGTAILAGTEVVISQRDQQFHPGTVTVGMGQPLVIENDDGGTIHHAYVESDAFNFDSGDQNPGGRTTIVFPSKGEFQVLCGIHPKMKLDVHVK